MQEESKEAAVNPGKKRLWIFIPLGLFLAFTVYYTVMVSISSSRKVNEINAEYGYKQGEKNHIDRRMFTDSAFVSLNREKAYYQARNLLADRDSICLSLNLHDSLAFLEISGVTVHTVRLQNIRMSKVLTASDDYAVSTMLSVPFNVQDNFSTIEKEPMMLKVAPKDTSEYKPDMIPDTSNIAPVFYMMQMDNGFRIYVYESDRADMMKRIAFDLTDRLGAIKEILKSIIVFKVPEYHPYIRLRMRKVDARSIYRALPVHAQIAVFR